jgi:hypothetical protein
MASDRTVAARMADEGRVLERVRAAGERWVNGQEQVRVGRPLAGKHDHPVAQLQENNK